MKQGQLQLGLRIIMYTTTPNKKLTFSSDHNSQTSTIYQKEDDLTLSKDPSCKTPCGTTAATTIVYKAYK